MDAYDRDLLKYADDPLAATRALYDPGFRMTRRLREALERRKADYHKDICYTTVLVWRDV